MENENTIIESPHNGIRPSQIFDVNAEVFDGELNSDIGTIVNISRVQDEAGWVIKYYVRVANPNVDITALPLNMIRRSYTPYGSVTLQRNDELMLITIDFNPYMRPITNTDDGWKNYILWHYNYSISDENASLYESEYSFGL
jgi:hypothetical protein